MRKTRILIILLMIIIGSIFSRGNIYAKTSNILIEPKENINAQQGIASWYSKRSPGIRKHTANNEIFNDTKLTAAMWDVPFNQMVKVTNLENGKSIIVRVNDRGPHRRLVREGRIIDLSKHAFSRIAPLENGLIRIELELL